MGGKSQQRSADARVSRAQVCFLLFLIVLVGFLAGCMTDATRSPGVVIVISDRLASHQRVADALSARLGGDVPRYMLDGDPRRAAEVVDTLRGQKSTVIAVGSLAARATVELSDRSVVICQDLSADEKRSRAVNARSVYAAPPPAKQLQLWKTLDPQLRRVTMMSGAGSEAFAREAQAAASHLKIRLDIVDARNDRELLYAVKRLDADVRGVWLVPNARALSPDVLRETLAYTVRQGKSTLVFDAELLRLGALISVEADPDDVAERVIEQLRASTQAPRVVSLQRAKARINIEIAKQLGLAVPAAMRDGSYVF